MIKSTKAIGFARFCNSSEPNKEDVEKEQMEIQKQKDKIVAWCQESNMDLIEIVESTNFSYHIGEPDNNVDIIRALSLCKEHEAVLVLTGLERLSRDISWLAECIKSVTIVLTSLPIAEQGKLWLAFSQIHCMAKDPIRDSIRILVEEKMKTNKLNKA